MKESRSSAIHARVFSKSDIVRLAQLLFNEHRAQTKGSRTSVTFKIICADNTSYETETLDLFSDGEVLDTKPTLSIQMSFFNYSSGDTIDIALAHGHLSYSNNLSVRGSDRNWVAGTFTRLNECVTAVNPQDNWIFQHKTIILHGLALGLGITGLSIVSWIFDIISPAGLVIAVDQNTLGGSILFWLGHLRFSAPWALPFIFLSLSWLSGISVAFLVRDWLLALWPDVEFDFGPEYLKLEKSRRIRLATVLSIVVIPLILSLGYDFIKPFFTK